MKLTKFANLLVLGLVLTLAASACRKRPDYVTKIPPGKTQNPGDIPGGNPINPGEKGGITESEKVSPIIDPNVRKDWPRDRDVFKAYTVHFAFDSSVVNSSERSKVTSVAEHLKANPQDAVEIEGHCDERGTEEYNRSLGERRALALRQELVGLGIDASRIDTISFGKDRPVATGHDDAAWKQNRRGEFILEVHPK